MPFRDLTGATLVSGMLSIDLTDVALVSEDGSCLLMKVVPLSMGHSDLLSNVTLLIWTLDANSTR